MLIAPVGFANFDYTKLFPKLEKEVKSIEKYILLEDLAGKYKFSGKAPKYADYKSYIKQLKPKANQLPQVDISPHDMVNVEFTSGSTGLPKNVSLSHYNIMNCGRFIWQQVRMTDEDRVCLPVPLFHSFGMIVGMSECFILKLCKWTDAFHRYQLKHRRRLCACPPKRVIQRKGSAPMYRQVQVYGNLRSTNNVCQLHGTRGF